MGKEMASEGRWVIVLADGQRPVFWSHDRATIDAVCRVLSRACPQARVMWERWPSDTGDGRLGNMSGRSS